MKEKKGGCGDIVSEPYRGALGDPPMNKLSPKVPHLVYMGLL